MQCAQSFVYNCTCVHIVRYKDSTHKTRWCAQQRMWIQQCVQCSHWASCTVHIELVHGAVTQECVKCAPSPSVHRERTVVVNCADCGCCWSSVASQCTAGPTAAPIVSARAGGSLTPPGLIPSHTLELHPRIPWNSHIYTLVHTAYLGTSWYNLVYPGIPLYSLMCLDTPWSTTIWPFLSQSTPSMDTLVHIPLK